MGSHAGTHIDAPLHFVRDGRTIDTIPLDATVGRARVIEIKDKEAIKPEELTQYQIQAGERVLFKTENSKTCWQCDEFLEEYIGITKEAAQMLVDCGVRSVGIDYLAVGGYHADILETHQILLGAGIWLIEGLDLIDVTPGVYELSCLPLKILGCDSSPARAIVRPVNNQREGSL